MKKKGSSLFKKLSIMFVIVIMVILSLVLIDMRCNSFSFIFKDGVFFIDKLFNFYDKNSEFESLKIENETLKIYKNENEELKEEIKKLKGSLDLNKVLSDKILINASVVNRNLDYWKQSLNLDKGKNDGIDNNMAVLSNGYLVGIVSDVTNSSSSVSLLCNDSLVTSISVKLLIDGKYVYGILNNYRNGFYDIMGIVENIEIPKDTKVYTSGLSSYIPSGIEIGKVDSVVTDNFDLSKIVKVRPGTNFDDISYVMVVKGEV